MRWRTSRGGPATRIRPVLTSIGGVRAVMTNPVAWTVDPCSGCIPWPHRYDSEPTISDEPASIWGAAGASAALTSATPGTLTSGGGDVPPGAGGPVPAPQPPTTKDSLKLEKANIRCPSGQIVVDVGNRYVCKVPFGKDRTK